MRQCESHQPLNVIVEITKTRLACLLNKFNVINLELDRRLHNKTHHFSIFFAKRFVEQARVEWWERWVESGNSFKLDCLI